MPAPARYPTPAAQTAASLRVCRDAGLLFEEAWEVALRGRKELSVSPMRWPHDTEVRQAWRRALRQTCPEWRACYYAEETPTGEMFKRLLAGAQDREVQDFTGLERVVQAA